MDKFIGIKQQEITHKKGERIISVESLTDNTFALGIQHKKYPVRIYKLGKSSPSKMLGHDNFANQIKKFEK